MFSLEVRQKPSKELYELAYIAGHASRFARDPSLTRAQFERMFRTWMKNIVKREVADEVFGCAKTGTNDVIGFISVKLEDDGFASVPLFAVSASVRGRGIGAMLMNRVLLWCEEHRRVLRVDTQAENAIARSFYEKFGFVEEVATVTKRDYHIWMPVKGIVRANVPYVTYRESENLKSMFRTKEIESMGPFTARAKKWIEEKIGSSCVLLSGSATAALDHAAILSGVEHRDEVIIPSYTFVSTANCFALRGATLVYVDVRADTLNIDETKIEAAITSRTKAICVVHYAGLPCEMDTIMEIAKRHNLIVIEDAAQAFLSTYKGRFLGSIGHLACFSFHYTKNVIAGEGGALCVNDPRFINRAYVVWEKGTNRFEFLQGKVDKYCWIDIGSSFVPNECMSAFLCAQLDESEQINAKRKAICSAYSDALNPLKVSHQLQFLPDSENNGNGHLFWIIFPTTELFVSAQKALKELEVQCFTHYVALHSSPAGEKYGRVHDSLDVTNVASKRLIRLPVWNAMNWQHVWKVVSAFYVAVGATPPPRAQIHSHFTP
jgi:dTDP-4-amino-4,6-dideoxygalactose transaminase